MTKNKVKLLVVLIVVNVFLLYLLFSSSNTKYVKTSKSNDITRYEWMEMLCEQVGMTEYENSELIFQFYKTTLSKNVPMDFSNIIYNDIMLRFFAWYVVWKIEQINTGKSVKKKDTKKPTVKGIKNGKTYKKSVKFKVSDKSGIKKVTLNKKKISVSKAKKGYRVKKKGKYTLKVWDKAGNVRTVKFKIKK